MAKKKESFSKKFIIVGLVLIGVQLSYIFLFTREGGSSFVEQMNRTVAEDTSIPAERKAQVKIQLALRDYQVKMGALPEKLEQLVPAYFDAVPLDPATAEPFKYTKLEDGRFYLGDAPEESGSDGGKKKDDGTKGGPGGKDPKKSKDGLLSEDDEAAIIAMINNNAEQTDNFVYDPSGKVDPFRSFDFSPQKTEPVGDTPLEQFDYKDLKLTAVLEGIGEPKAIVEAPGGKGFTVQVGSKIGVMGGKIMKIEPDRLVILESVVEWDQEKKTRTVEMFLR